MGIAASPGKTPMFQVITPDGEINHEYVERFPHYRKYVESVSDDTLLDFFRDLVRTRRFDAEATALQRHGELALWSPSYGQEAAQIGSARATIEADRIFPSYREHGVALSRGITPGEVMALYRGVTHGGWDIEQTGVQTPTLVLGAHTLHAVGYAMGISQDARRQGQPALPGRAVVAYFGDGSTSEGDVHEACVFAASFAAPAVLFCQNNQWAISEPVALQTKVPLADRAAGYGFPGVLVDGNDVLAVYAATAEALDRARNGGGPTFIEAYTYRRGAHTTADDPTRYRDPAADTEWESKDPIKRLETYLLDTGVLSDELLHETEQELDIFGEEVRAACHGLRPAAPESIFDNVYSEIDPGLQEERAAFVEYVNSFASTAQGENA